MVQWIEHQPAHCTKGSQVHIPPPPGSVWEAASQYVSHVNLSLWKTMGKRYPWVRIDTLPPPQSSGLAILCVALAINCSLNHPPRLKPSNDSHSQTIKKSLLTYFSISGAQCTNSWFQNLNAGFLISSMKVISRPQGCGLFTINRSKRTLEKGRVS